MAVTVTNLGSDSTQLYYTGAETLSDIKTAVETYITAHGWSVYDAAAGTNAICYRASNVDAFTHKYVVLNYNTSGYVIMNHYQLWNATNHTGTNQASQSDSTTYSQRLAIGSGGYLYIFATARYLAMLSLIGSSSYGSSTGESLTGIFEHTRDAIEDTGVDGLPASVWINGYLLTSTGNPAMSPCKDANNITSATASYHAFAATVVGRSCYHTSIGLVNSIPSTLNPYTSKNYVFTLYCGQGDVQNSSYSRTIRGKVYGLKIITNGQGAHLDRIDVPVDADKFLDPNGTPTEHIVIAATTGARLILPV